MTSFRFQTSPLLVNQLGGAQLLGDFCRQLSITKPLVVTDRGVMAAGLLAGPLQALVDAGIEPHLFEDTVPDPPESVVLRACDAAREARIDGVIGFGGGSAMDTAKLVALLVKSEQAIDDIYGVDNAVGERLPLILVPTTAGTGSEVTPIAIVTTGEDSKKGVVAAQLFPDIAVLDAQLTIGLPALVTASTGVDAMVHAIEAYTGIVKKNPYSDMLAREALRLLSANILTAVDQPKNLEARQNMLFGACLAGQAFANSPVAAVHALAYPLGGQFHVSHGLSNALVLPEVLKFNTPKAARHYAELAPLIMSANQSREVFRRVASDIGDAEQQSFLMIEFLQKLTADCGLPQRLRDIDIPEHALESLAKDAMLQQRLLVNNPRPVAYSDALSIYRAVY